MDVFKDQWEKQVRILTEAVDDITSVDDFLSVSGMQQHRSVHGTERGSDKMSPTAQRGASRQSISPVIGQIPNKI